MNHTKLDQLKPGDTAMIKTLEATGSIRRRLLDLGFVEGTPVLCVLKHRTGESAAYRVRGTTIVLRREDAADIQLRPKNP